MKMWLVPFDITCWSLCVGQPWKAAGGSKLENVWYDFSKCVSKEVCNTRYIVMHSYMHGLCKITMSLLV